MSRAAVLGRPVAHSLSPVLHRAAYTALGLTDWTYDALDIGSDDLPVLLAGLGEEGRGVFGGAAGQRAGGGGGAPGGAAPPPLGRGAATRGPGGGGGAGEDAR